MQISETLLMTGRLGRRRLAPTREAIRFKLLIEQLEKSGVSQSEMARLTGIETSHINKLRNIETTGRGAIGAEIVRKVKDGLKIDPAYFYDDYEGEKDHRLFLLSAKRDERRVSALEAQGKKAELDIVELAAELAMTRAELVKLRQEVAQPAKGGSNVNQKRR